MDKVYFMHLIILCIVMGVFVVSLHLFPLHPWEKKNEDAMASPCNLIGSGMKIRKGGVLSTFLYTCTVRVVIFHFFCFLLYMYK